MKNKVRPDFEKNPEKYYPVDVFKNFGFSRAQCSCGHFYWRKSEKATCCGDCTYLTIDVGVRENTHLLGKAQASEEKARRSPTVKLGRDSKSL